MDSETVSIKKGHNKSEKLFADIPWKIYFSRGLSAWGDRLWAFGAGIFMVGLAPENLRLVAIYGLVLNLGVILFGAAVGDWIDNSKRLSSARTFLAIQNLVTALSCVLLGLYFGEVGKASWPDWIPSAAPPVTIILAAVSQLASVGSKIVVEKDWIVVISEGDEDKLAKINSVFRTIDLATLTLAPLSAGLIFDFISTSAAAYFIAGWNLVSVCFEYALLKMIYNDFPDLAHKKILEAGYVVKAQETKKTSTLWDKIIHIGHGWKVYMTYNVRNAGLGLACLYMTVLGFDNITYGFCLQQCVTESVLGALIGVSAIFGVSGSISFPFMRTKFGLKKTGMVGMTCLLLALSMCVISIWLEGSPFEYNYFQADHGNTTMVADSSLDGCYTPSFLSVGLLLAGIISARFGLWISDLSISQILQEKVEEEHRGVIGGVQNGLNSIMDTIKFVLVIVLPQNETFGWLIIASFCFVALGAISYASYAIKSDDKKDVNISVPDPVITTYQATSTVDQQPVNV